MIFYVKFLILDFEDCQFTFGSTSFWVVLDFWVFSFGFWILRSVGPPLIAHLIWVVLDFFILSFLLWILQNVGPPLISYLLDFYFEFLIIDFADCQSNFGSKSLWVVLFFWVLSFGFWILRSVSPPLIVHLFWVVVLDYVR